MIETEEQARAYVAGLCDGRAMVRLERLVTALGEENERQNLVARNSLSMVWQRHIADSAQLLNRDDLGVGPWLDLGSGAGFPGLVIAAMRPELPVILVESRKRRIEWLAHCVQLLGLGECRIEGRRLELVESFPARVISARAFAPLDRLLRLSARFSTSDTRWLLPKGRSAEQEVQGLTESLRQMFHVEHSLTDPEAGIVIGCGQWKETA
ncbi:16S rRNA (guanine(527)-N(7))-methyltransferase RsmG [Erythrobacter mangrovi]|uniref:Ribosomal RNA small subunit methyltransferase G n=1 Tax=Erythrobacter mangrovi TaxID=2739433 RepID=A0A7D3XR17_9SPHN|nr:16S rRNA (guanine(527)-N(7))-methyltransferase RsmG [Erythrobacter mangrovi]QKG70911.1 16S rRNA (guanine(527)-N(7))-methyltransferase RsmG [Erythrobacter mangrovi]